MDAATLGAAIAIAKSIPNTAVGDATAQPTAPRRLPNPWRIPRRRSLCFRRWASRSRTEKFA